VNNQAHGDRRDRSRARPGQHQRGLVPGAAHRAVLPSRPPTSGRRPGRCPFRRRPARRPRMPRLRQRRRPGCTPTRR
jgi:hypothetical protein